MTARFLLPHKLGKEKRESLLTFHTLLASLDHGIIFLTQKLLHMQLPDSILSSDPNFLSFYRTHPRILLHIHLQLRRLARRYRKLTSHRRVIYTASPIRLSPLWGNLFSSPHRPLLRWPPHHRLHWYQHIYNRITVMGICCFILLMA